MKNSKINSENAAKKIGILGMGLCVVCCAIPVLGLAGGGAGLAMLSLYAEKIALALFIISLSLFGFWYYRKRQAPACSIDCASKKETVNSEKI